jgi:hypothetical protein
MLRGKVKLIANKELQGQKYALPMPQDLDVHVAGLRKHTKVLWVRKGNELVGAGTKMDKTCSVCFATPHRDSYAIFEEQFGPRTKRHIPADIDFHDGDAFKQLKRLYKVCPDKRLLAFFNGPVGVENKRLNDAILLAKIKGTAEPSKDKVNNAAKAFLRSLDLK